MAKRKSSRVFLSVEALEDRCLMDATVCIVPPVPGSPGVPRLSLPYIPMEVHVQPAAPVQVNPGPAKPPIIIRYDFTLPQLPASPQVIPPSFFDPGSSDFPFIPPALGGTNKEIPNDTVVKRLGGPDLGHTGGSSTVPIEILQLDLQSVAPVQGGGTFTPRLNARPIQVFFKRNDGFGDCTVLENSLLGGKDGSFLTGTRPRFCPTGTNTNCDGNGAAVHVDLPAIVIVGHDFPDRIGIDFSKILVDPDPRGLRGEPMGMVTPSGSSKAPVLLFTGYTAGFYSGYGSRIDVQHGLVASDNGSVHKADPRLLPADVRTQLQSNIPAAFDHLLIDPGTAFADGLVLNQFKPNGNVAAGSGHPSSARNIATSKSAPAAAP